ncbi:uncharacterized protein H6S33_002566 [Morchella sextelata]|uniref:uncharacterized protein n=1 Tax=Morchella sextelata TaxID=1174677 RepID=UPI001D036127|nr:uncharacterized protein H6S33_002566 [Morchella sextelata]KAH0607532.1 hypothetical protein H6S33_002566 [Morchella sextelata]
MAHRIIAQIALVGGRVVGRAFVEAWRQAQATQKYAKAAAAGRVPDGQGGASLRAHSGLTLDEACRILNVKPPQEGKIEIENVMERFKKLFDINDPKKGGSFYLQSKVLRARERIEAEVRAKEEKTGEWRPKVYK